MKAKSVKMVTVVAITGILSGCATMFTDKTQKISFKTKPTGAEVAVGTLTCITPCTLTVEKGKWNVQAIVTKDGYGTQNIVMVPKVEPWAWANIANFGVGIIVDYATGAAIRYEDEYYAPLARN